MVNLLANRHEHKSTGMNHFGWRLLINLILRIAWVSFLVALPVTSFPYFPPAFGGEALVRPLSLFPLLVLIPLAIIPRLITRPIPKIVIPLLAFVLIAVASSTISLLRGIEPAMGVAVNVRILRGLVTLLIGCAFYLTVALLPDRAEDLHDSLRWIYVGGSLALLWGSLQILYIIRFEQKWFRVLARIQHFISTRRLRADRIVGLTYEPHWFADQILLLLLPWLIASVINGFSVFRWRWRWLTIELILLVWCLLLIPFTFSRAGLLNLIVLVFLAVLLLRPKNKQMNKLIRLALRGLAPSLRLPLEVMLVIVIITLPIYLIGTQNTFFSRIWDYWQNKDHIKQSYFTYLGLDARITYLQAAYNTYLAHPILGVGLGNYAFYFEEMLPYRPIAEVPEALRMITPEKGRARLITSKNFYLRLLSETGVIGASTFIAFVISNLGYGLYLWFSTNKETKYWGTASLCGLIAFFLSAATFDSFVIPNIWIVFGLIAAATRILLHNPIQELTSSNP